MHLVDVPAGFVGAVPIVASTIPIATGLAFANRLQRRDRVVVAFFGEAATEEGAFHESANFASLHRLPIVFNSRFYVVNGGLASYGPDFVDMFRRSAGYVDRILRGEKPADLPVQTPVKYELTLNLRTAKALGMTLPPALLTRADEVVE